jgi:hypothetical protein
LLKNDYDDELFDDDDELFMINKMIFEWKKKTNEKMLKRWRTKKEKRESEFIYVKCTNYESLNIRIQRELFFFQYIYIFRMRRKFSFSIFKSSNVTKIIFLSTHLYFSNATRIIFFFSTSFIFSNATRISFFE